MFRRHHLMATASTQPTVQRPASRPGLVAPLWHTGIVLLILLIPWIRWLGVPKVLSNQPGGLILIYALLFQWGFFVLLYFGLRIQGTRLKDLIGERWRSFQDFFKDLRVGLIVCGFNVLLLFLFGHLWRLVVQHTARATIFGGFSALEGFGGVLAIALTAGFTEEVTCRGYLQQQFHAVTGSARWAFVL